MTCAKQVVTATLITTAGNVYIGRNDCANPQAECPRGEMPSGEGYHLCREVCRQAHHAEVAALTQAGEAAKGATIYVTGHHYICRDCQAAIERAGVAFSAIGRPLRYTRCQR